MDGADRAVTPAVEAISRNWDALLSGLEGEQRLKVAQALNRLRENLIRLRWRHDDLIATGQLLTRATMPDYSGPSSREVQLRFIDKVDAFHQHIYATLAVLALVLNHVRKDRKEQPYPVGTISKFLATLKGRVFQYQHQYLRRVGVLERSADFRSKYVDHPERHELHNWMTMRYFDKHLVIYYLEKGGEVTHRAGSSDPFSPDFQPPVNCGDDFYVSPDPDETCDALEKVVTRALQNVLDRARTAERRPDMVEKH